MSTGVGRLVAALALTVVTVTGCAEEDGQDALDQAREQASAAAEDAQLDTELPDVDVPDVKVPDVKLPDVNWDKYSGDLKERIDKLASNADCSELKTELEKVEGNDSDLTRYIKEQLQAADC